MPEWSEWEAPEPTPEEAASDFECDKRFCALLLVLKHRNDIAFERVGPAGSEIAKTIWFLREDNEPLKNALGLLLGHSGIQAMRDKHGI